MSKPQAIHPRMVTRHIGHDSCMLISSLAAIPRQNRMVCPVILVSIWSPSRPYLGKIKLLRTSRNFLEHRGPMGKQYTFAAIPRQNQSSENIEVLWANSIPSRPYLGKIKLLRTSRGDSTHRASVALIWMFMIITKMFACAKVEVVSRIAITFIFKRKQYSRNQFIREQNELISDDPKILLPQQ